MGEPYHADPWLTVYQGDCREVMAEMEPESVHCVVTSPPYWGLRDYGTTGQLGLEPTPEEYVENMVAVFREVRRVLRKDGTVWLNLGDSYAASGGDDRKGSSDGATGRGDRPDERRRAGLKPKDLVGIPWRVAFALQADGWYLRSDIIWSKPNPMPESVTDRPTKAHEYLFLLTKSPRYYFDADAVREPFGDERMGNPGGGVRNYAPGDRNDGTDSRMLSWDRGAERGGRNLRTVWTIATQPYPGAHFATFPEALVEPCVKAGTSERGVCPECGAPWTRVQDIKPMVIDRSDRTHSKGQTRASGTMVEPRTAVTTGWQPSCGDETQSPVPAVVLDPFAGSGTVGRVAQRLSRRAVLIDLNADYLVQTMRRNADIPLGLGA